MMYLPLDEVNISIIRYSLERERKYHRRRAEARADEPEAGRNDQWRAAQLAQIIATLDRLIED